MSPGRHPSLRRRKRDSSHSLHNTTVTFHILYTFKCIFWRCMTYVVLMPSLMTPLPLHPHKNLVPIIVLTRFSFEMTFCASAFMQDTITCLQVVEQTFCLLLFFKILTTVFTGIPCIFTKYLSKYISISIKSVKWSDSSEGRFCYSRVINWNFGIRAETQLNELLVDFWQNVPRESV